MKKLKIEALKEEFLDVLLTMLLEFAHFENKQAHFQNDKEKLRALFLKDNLGKAFILKENDEVIGYLIYFYTLSSFRGSMGIYVEDIYIREKFRHRGYGKQVFHFLSKLCKKEKIHTLTWVCLNENKMGIKFYKSLGARHMNEIRTYRLEGDKLDKLCDS